jgi:hypothetical protein
MSDLNFEMSAVQELFEDLKAHPTRQPVLLEAFLAVAFDAIDDKGGEEAAPSQPPLPSATNDPPIITVDLPDEDLRLPIRELFERAFTSGRPASAARWTFGKVGKNGLLKVAPRDQ